MLRILPIGGMYVTKSDGARTDPCGTPCLIETVEKVQIPHLSN